VLLLGAQHKTHFISLCNSVSISTVIDDVAANLVHVSDGLRTPTSDVVRAARRHGKTGGGNSSVDALATALDVGIGVGVCHMLDIPLLCCHYENRGW
jgi:hypothetical protein